MCTSPTCNHKSNKEPKETVSHRDQSRRTFFRQGSLLAAGAMLPSSIVSGIGTDIDYKKAMLNTQAVRNKKAQVITILHTSDIHAQLHTHDEFFWENGKAVFKKRGGFAVLKTMLQTLRKQNPENTLLIDGGDCFQGGGLAALTNGRGIVPMVNHIGYDLILPGNWEVVYGKEAMWRDLGGYKSNKICANMYHDTQDEFKGELIFPPYWIKNIGGIKIGFIGYNDPMTPKRQSPAYSQGITFTKPESNVSKYIKLLKEYEQCAMVFLVTHMGLAQQVDLANKPEVQGIDYILGADTHERVRIPISGKYTKVTEPGAFGSFVSRLDIIIENGKVKDHHYELLDVDPKKYQADKEMLAIIEEQRAPFRNELDKVIGSSRETLLRYYVIENPIDNMLTDALMWKYEKDGIDIVLSNGFRFCPPLVVDEETGLANITNDYLWSMFPVNSEVKRAIVSGKQIWDWMEKELNNVFATNPAQRFGGWVIRFKGMTVNFTIQNEMGKRVNHILIKDKPINPESNYHILACEREGDPNDTLCRIEKVSNPIKTGHLMHDIVREYLAKHSPVSPKIEGRAVATDAPSTLLSQLEGYDYVFR